MSSKASVVACGRATVWVSRTGMKGDGYSEDTPAAAGWRQDRQGASPIQRHKVIYDASSTRSLLIHHHSTNRLVGALLLIHHGVLMICAKQGGALRDVGQSR